MIITGNARLGKDPKMQYTPKGVAQTTFSLAFTTGFGEYEKTVWVSAICWDKLAEFTNQHLKKGSMVFATLDVTENRAYENEKGIGASLNAKLLSVDFVNTGKPQGKKADAENTTPYDNNPDIIELDDDGEVW